MPPSASESTLPPVAHLERKGALLLAAVTLLLAGAVFYLLHARGAFEPTQQLSLSADDAEGVVVGMDLTFAGFPIGRVRAIELAGDGSARIVVELPRKDAHWLRTSSVFTLTRGLVGGTALRAYSGIPDDPPLAAGATRKVLVGDANAEIPRLLGDLRALVQHVDALAAPDAALAASLANLQRASARLNGPHGALGLLFGNDADARRLAAAVGRSDALLAKLGALTDRLDALSANANAQIFGRDGALGDLRADLNQLNGLLGDARSTLQRVDAVLVEAQATAANLRSASTDLGVLRAEVESSLRRAQHLIDEIERKWPFARDAQIRLP